MWFTPFLPGTMHFPWFVTTALFMLQPDYLLLIHASENERSQAKREPEGSSPGRSAEYLLRRGEDILCVCLRVTDTQCEGNTVRHLSCEIIYF